MKAAMKLGAAHTLRAGKLAAAWTETVNTFGSRWKMLAVPSPCPGFCRESKSGTPGFVESVDVMQRLYLMNVQVQYEDSLDAPSFQQRRRCHRDICRRQSGCLDKGSSASVDGLSAGLGQQHLK